jgi:hypothetical protein
MVNPIFGLDRKTNKQWSARQYGDDQKNIRVSSSSSLSTTVPHTNYTPKEMVRNYNDKLPQHKTGRIKGQD